MPEKGDQPKSTKPVFTRANSMIRVKRTSLSDDFEVSPDIPIPEVPQGGARVRVCFAGACYTDREVEQSGKQYPNRSPGILDTSLFPGFEVSGVIDDICNTVSHGHFEIGDRVIVYPDDKEKLIDAGYAQYITVHNVDNLVKLKESVSLEVASLLGSGALTAYSAILRAKPFIEAKVTQAAKDDVVNILIVGAGALGLWTIKMCWYLLEDIKSRVHITVADTSIEKLLVAKEYGCFDVVHWYDALHEEYILERIKNVCVGGVDVVIDFVSSMRTVNRALKVLSYEGVLLVGGNARYEIPFNLNALAHRQLSILGVHRGTRQQLKDLVEAFSQGKISAPAYTIFPVDEANKVFQQLSKCEINGRAILHFAEPDNFHGNDDEVFDELLSSIEQKA